MENENKTTTLDTLAGMVASGFEHIETKFKHLEDKFEHLETRMDGLETKMLRVENSIEALNNNVKNYLELSDKRYLELKHRDEVFTMVSYAI